MFEESAENRAGKGTWGLIVLGPIFGMLYVCLLPLIGLMTLLLALPEFATAKKPDILEKGGMCMSCHASQGMTKVFKNNEKLSVTVRPGDFRVTVHSSLNCTDCHQKISLESHPGTAYESRGAFTLEAAAACRTCHPDSQLSARPMHAFLTNKTNAPPCTNCHGAHSVKRIAELKPALTDNQYCLTCHSQRISERLSNGEELSLFIDRSLLSSSVHNKHACSDCHSEFSKDSHPVRTYSSSRAHSISVSQACMKCHSDKIKAVRDSIHYNPSFPVGEIMVSRGNSKAPVCTDCHGFHSVGPKATFDTLSGVPCRKCHEEIFKVYSKSVHGMARANGQHKAPLCSSCHFAHDITVTAMAEKIKSACLGCHKGIETVHKKWLPNAELHMSAVACAACHSPDSGKGIYLRLEDQTTGKPFTEEQVMRLLGTTYDGLSRKMNAHGDGIGASELWSIVQQLNEKGTNAKVTFFGKLNVSKGVESHQLAFKKRAVKECETCHSKNSDFFKSVTVAIVKADGKLSRYKARPEVLGSMFSMLSLRQFYVIGATRLTLLDWLGILMVAGGIMVPVAHITARILTSPIREARKQHELRKGGKR